MYPLRDFHGDRPNYPQENWHSRRVPSLPLNHTPPPLMSLSLTPPQQSTPPQQFFQQKHGAYSNNFQGIRPTFMSLKVILFSQSFNSLPISLKNYK